MTDELKQILSPEFLEEIADSFIPLGKQDPNPNLGEVIKKSLFTYELGKGFSALYSRIWPALPVISKFGLDNIPDWFELLPPVEDPKFPSQALGLLLVLDQGPRQILKGVDQRWTSAYFDDIAGQFALRLEDLPSEVRPSSWERWKDSVTFEYWIMLRMAYGAPIVHNENMADRAIAFTNETRVAVEEKFGVRDPIRDQPEKRWELLGFPRVLSSGGPDTPCDTPTAASWLHLLMDVHKPPLDKFGRYPYRNWILDREMTPEEDEWIKEAGFFKPPPDEVIAKIKEDMAKGIWSPLGTGGSGKF